MYYTVEAETLGGFVKNFLPHNVKCKGVISKVSMARHRPVFFRLPVHYYRPTYAFKNRCEYRCIFNITGFRTGLQWERGRVRLGSVFKVFNDPSVNNKRITVNTEFYI
jgi:hypothetical protein